MTTKVRISIVQPHRPVVVETLRSDGTVQQKTALRATEDVLEEYVHSGQGILVREMTTEEEHKA